MNEFLNAASHGAGYMTVGLAAVGSVIGSGIAGQAARRCSNAQDLCVGELLADLHVCG